MIFAFKAAFKISVFVTRPVLMIHYKYAFAILFLLTVSCFNKQTDTQHRKRTIESITFEEVSIPIDTAALVYYRKNSPFVFNGENCLAGYNPIRHTIDLFNLDKKSFITRISLNRHGPNEVLKVYGLFVHNLDSIFIFDPTGIKLLSEKGTVHKLSHQAMNGSLIAASGSGIFYDAQSRSLLMYFQAEDFESNGRETGLSKPIVAELFLETGKVNLLAVHYSQYIRDNKGDFSSDIIPNLSFYNDRIICNFVVDSEICLYNRKGNLSGCFPALSNTSENRSSPYSQDGMGIEHRMLTNTMFQKVFYLNKDNLYVRAHWGNQPILTNDMKPTTMMTKPASLMLFDEVFNPLIELSLDREKYFPDDYFTTSEALYIWRDFTKAPDEDSLQLGRMNIRYIK